MSSILKALQRLQGDRGEGALPEPQPALGDELARELAQGPASPPEAAPPLARARLTLIGVGAAAALCATAGLGWWLARGPAAAPPLAESAPPPASALPLPEPDPPSGTLRRARPARPSAAPEEAPTLPASVEPRAEQPAERAEAAAAPAEPATARAAAAPPAPAPRTAPPAALEMGGAPAAHAEAAAPLADVARARAAPAAKPAEAPRIELVAEAPEPTAAPPVAAAPRAEPRAGTPPPSVEVLRTTWHPKPERRVARLRIAGFAAPVEVREGDAISTLVVKTIEPSGVLFLHGGAELRRDVGKR